MEKGAMPADRRRKDLAGIEGPLITPMKYQNDNLSKLKARTEEGIKDLRVQCNQKKQPMRGKILLLCLLSNRQGCHSNIGEALTGAGWNQELCATNQRPVDTGS